MAVRAACRRLESDADGETDSQVHNLQFGVEQFQPLQPSGVEGVSQQCRRFRAPQLSLVGTLHSQHIPVSLQMIRSRGQVFADFIQQHPDCIAIPARRSHKPFIVTRYIPKGVSFIDSRSLLLLSD